MAETQTYEWRDQAANPGGVKPAKPGLFDVVNPSPNQTGAQAAQVAGVIQPSQTNPFSQQNNNSTATQPFQPRTFGALFDNAGRQQNIQAAQQTIQNLLAPQEGPNKASQLSRSEFDKQAAETARQASEQSALAGRMGTGQIVGDQLRTGDRILGARRDMESTLQANEEQQQLARQQAGLGALTNLEQLSQQETLQKAQIGSSEKIAFANLAQQDKALAQDAMQFTSKQDFDKWALEKNLDENTKTRIWQATENEKERAFKAGEGSLDRELQKYGLDQKLGLETKKLAETIRQFDTQDQFNRWAEQNKLDENQKQRLWQSNENDILYKHQKGMQLSDQEHDVLMSKLDKEIKADLMKVQSVLNITEIEKQGEINTMLEGIRQDGENYRQDKQINSTEYLAKFQADTQMELQARGFTHDQAMQASLLAAQAEEKRLDREQTDKWQAAEMLYKNDALKQEMGIKTEELNLRRDEIKNQASQWLEDFGLRKTQVNAALASEKMNNLLGTMAAMESMPGFENSPDMIAKYNKAMTDIMVDQGLISKDEARMGNLSATFSTFSSIENWEKWAGKNGYNVYEIQTILNDKGVDRINLDYGKLNPKDLTGGGKSGVVNLTQNAQGDPIATIDGKKITDWNSDDWKNIAKSPTQIKSLVEDGVIKDVGSGQFARTGDIMKWIGDNGIAPTNYTKNGDNIQFTGNENIIVQNGKPYILDHYSTRVKKDWSGDEFRYSDLYAKDPLTGKIVKIGSKKTDI